MVCLVLAVFQNLLSPHSAPWCSPTLETIVLVYWNVLSNNTWELMAIQSLAPPLPSLKAPPPHTHSPPLRPIPLVPEAHHSSLSHTVTFDSQGRDYGDQINYDLIPKRRRRHYSKSRSAKALMTIDCPNIACVLAATRAAAPSVPASVSGDRKWIVLHVFIDIAFHLRWPGRYSCRKMPGRKCFIHFSLPLSFSFLFVSLSCCYFCICQAGAHSELNQILQEAAQTRAQPRQMTLTLPSLVLLSSCSQINMLQ